MSEKQQSEPQPKVPDSTDHAFWLAFRRAANKNPSWFWPAVRRGLRQAADAPHTPPEAARALRAALAVLDEYYP